MIDFASSRCTPSACVRDVRSLPARSTNVSRASLASARAPPASPPPRSARRSRSVNTVCPRDDARLSAVAATDFARAPSSRSESTSCTEVAGCEDRPSTNSPPGPSRTCAKLRSRHIKHVNSNETKSPQLHVHTCRHARRRPSTAQYKKTHFRKRGPRTASSAPSSTSRSLTASRYTCMNPMATVYSKSAARAARRSKRSCAARGMSPSCRASSWDRPRHGTAPPARARHARASRGLCQCRVRTSCMSCPRRSVRTRAPPVRKPLVTTPRQGPRAHTPGPTAFTPRITSSTAGSTDDLNTSACVALPVRGGARAIRRRGSRRGPGPPLTLGRTRHRRRTASRGGSPRAAAASHTVTRARPRAGPRSRPRPRARGGPARRRKAARTSASSLRAHAPHAQRSHARLQHHRGHSATGNASALSRQAARDVTNLVRGPAT